MANALVPLGGGVSDDSVHGGDMNGCRSLWLWLQWSTIRTGPLRTTPYEARRTVTRAGVVEERVLHDAPRRQKPPPPGTRPTLLVEVQPQGSYGAAQWHRLRALADLLMSLCCRSLNSRYGSGHSFFRNSVPAVAEQVIEVPKLAFPILCCSTCGSV